MNNSHRSTHHPPRLFFLHGLESSSRGYKGRLLSRLFGNRITTADFSGDLNTRLKKLHELADHLDGLVLIGSSFGGLMAARYALQRPQAVRQLVLLAPALDRTEWQNKGQWPAPYTGPVTLYHGTQDSVVDPQVTIELAGRLFSRLELHLVDDDHMLRPTVEGIDWLKLVNTGEN